MNKNQRIEILVGALLLGGVLLTRAYGYLLFHVLAEIFSIAIFVSVFITTWNSRRFTANAFLYMLGIAFLFAGILDLVHTLTFKGMTIIVGYDANLPTQLWIAARYMQSIGFLIAVLHVKQKQANVMWLTSYAGATTLALLSMFYWNIFPECYIEGVGLTPFKIASEYVISGILLVAIGLLWRVRQQFDPNVMRWLIASALVTVASEMAFTLYVDVYGILNLVGHILKIIAVMWVYKAVIEITLNKPYDSLFRELKKSEEQFKSYFELPLIGIGITAPDHGWIEINDRMCSILGYSRQELSKKTWVELTHPEDLANDLAQFNHIVAGEIEGYTLDKRFVHKDGHTIWTSLAVNCVRKPNGTIDYSIASVEDISKRKHAEEQVQKSREHLVKFASQVPGMLYQFEKRPDGSFCIPFATDAIRDIYGCTPEEVRDDFAPVGRVIHPQDLDNIIQAIDESARNLTPFYAEYRVIQPGKPLQWIEAHSIPEKMSTGSIVWSGFNTDITERKSIEQELATRNREIILLYQISDLMLKAESIEDAFHKIIADISAFTQFPIVVIETYDAKRQMMIFRESIGITLPSHPIEIPVAETLSGVVARTGKPLVEILATSRSEYANQFLRQLGVQTFVCVPIIVGEQVFGVLSLAHPQIVPVTDHMMQWVGSLANSIAASIARKQNEETIASLAKLPSENPNPILRLSHDGFIIYANSASRALLHDWNCRVGERAPLFWQQQIAEVLVQQANKTLETLCGTMVYAVTIAYLPNTTYVNLYLNDITLRKKAEAELRQLNNLYNMLGQINQVIVHTKDQILLFQEICRVAIEFGKYRMAWISVIDESGYKISPVAWAGEENGSLRDMQLAFLDAKTSPEPTGTAIREDRCVVCQDITSNPLWQAWHEWATRYEYESAVSVPIHQRGRIIGAFTVYTREPNTLDDRYQDLFKEIGGDISFALDTLQLEADRKQAEDALRESEDRFKYVFDHSAIGKSITKPGGKISVNQAYADMLGYSRHELAHRTWQELTHPDDVALNEAISTRLLNGEQEFARFIKRYIHKNGNIVWADVGVTLRRDEQGNPLYFFTSIMDITERKNAEDALRASEEKYRNLVEELEVRVQDRTAELQDLYDNSPAGYHSLDANDNFVAVNQTELNWTGYTRDEMIGRPITSIFTPASTAIFRDNMPRLKTDGRLAELELEIVRKDSSIFPVLANATAIYDVNGIYVTSRSTLVDITDRKKANDALRASRDALDLANQELERAARLKDEFLANMSHELRTPLNAVLGLAEGLQEQVAGTLNSKQLDMIGMIQASGRHLLELINDILDLAKIEAGSTTLELGPVNVKSLCNTSLMFIHEMALKKNIKSISVLDPAVEWIYADERRVKQMLVNLLSNAVKFTPEGGQMGLEMMGNPQTNEVRLTVWDTGIGISQQDLGRLFKPFVQLDSGLTRRYEGTGLGLSLVSRMAQMHGGKISVESELGKGSRFTIQLPWSKEMQTWTSVGISQTLDAQANPMPFTPNFGKNPPTILIVEDNEDNIFTISMYLEAKGYKILVAHHGGEALDIAHAQHPDVILMDLQMPMMDGLEATRRLRNHSDPQLAKVPILALTALAMPGDRERAVAAGVNEYIVKPVNPRNLVQMIEIHRVKQEREC